MIPTGVVHVGSIMKKSLLGLVAVASLSAPVVASSAVIVLTFEGVGDLNPVG